MKINFTRFLIYCSAFLFVICQLAVINCSAQFYENSWINYSQPYYKIKVAQDGIYRVPANFSISNWDAGKIQLFHNGAEQYIYIYDQNGNNRVDGADFIEFYGQKNDGSFDSQMYSNPAFQANPNYSLITDTSAYFLTVSNLNQGLRLINDTSTDYSSYLPADYFTKESYLEEHYDYNVGENDQDIDYSEGEGWMGTVLSSDYLPLSTVKVMNTQNVYSGSGAPNIEVNTTVVGANHNGHNLTITAPGINTSDFWYSMGIKHYSYSLIPTTFASASTSFTYSIIQPTNGIPDHTAFINLSVKYPHTMDMEGALSFKMYVPDAAGQTKARLDLTNFNLNSSSAILYDITNHRRIAVTPTSANSLQALINNDGTGNAKFCYLTTVSQTQTVNQLYAAGNNGIFTNYSALGIDSAYIILTNSRLMTPVNTYKTYRNLTTGNKVLVVDADELYDQFAYGIKNHGLGIKKFVHYILDKWTVPHPPQALFIVGKSLQPDAIRFDPNSWAKCLVASYGYPTSDMLLVSGINGAQWEPVIPIGRLSAQSEVDVTNYLDKVEQYESAQSGPPQEWMKEVLHFGGGDNLFEQTNLQGYLNEMKAIIEDTLYGAHVTSYFKNSPDPIIINQSDSLQAKINAGVSFMSFFGHASGSSFDISTDIPSNYGNYGKYPIILASSCFAGNVHSNGQSVGEQFVLQQGKAAIAFLASVGLGSAFYLHIYDTCLYQNLSVRNYGQPFGKIVQQTIKTLETVTSDANIKAVCNEMSLQGDPDIKFNSWQKPDYVAEEKNIFFTPNVITNNTDTFNLHFITRNFAKAVPDTFHVIITRTYPDGTDSTYTLTRSRCFYADTLVLTIPVGGLRGAGINNFRVKVDLPDSVSEIEDYANNQTTGSLFILSNDIIPVYPAKYAIHPYNTVTLKGSTVNPLAPTRTYKFEIDTAYFNDNPATRSPMYRTGNVSSSGGVVSWAPTNYFLMDSTVYYWRVFDDTTTIHKNESSFIYIPNKTGWSQAHFFQFNKDGYKNILNDSVNRKFDFVPNLVSLDAHDIGSPQNSSQYYNVQYALNGSPAEYSGCGTNPSIHIAVIDSLTLSPWMNCNANHGQVNLWNGDCNTGVGTGTCRSRPEAYFIYRLYDGAQLSRMRQFIDSVPCGEYILAYSWFTAPYSATFDTALVSMFADLGFPNLLTGHDTVPFIFFMRKCYPGTAQFVIGSSSTSVLDLHTSMQTKWYRGNIYSEIIGPAARWTTLHWKEHPVENGATKDSINLSVLGYYQSADRWDTLIKNVLPSMGDTSLMFINPLQYTYLKLDAFLEDDSLRTPPHLDRWQIYYDEAPECALNAAHHYSFYKDPISEGDTLKMSIAIDNIGNKPMDSLGVSFYMYDRNRVKHNLKTYKLDSLRVNGSLTAELAVDSTLGLYGLNNLWVEANPYSPVPYHQLEQYHFNNLAQVQFNMNRDVINPILDVTFDGIHILDGDIVSGKPQISVHLKDENKFLALNDTSNFRVYLKSPSSNTMTRLYFATTAWNDYLRFTPAILPKNSCKIDYAPVLAEDGIYTLEVEATDISKNESGKYDYKITFEVINKSTITEVLNYPNPFSTSTRFVFVLTGNEVPDQMRIRIMTVTGKVVREIMKSELGNIHIGRNITDYAWDGKDQYGDQLANGVYIYKFSTDFSSGKEIDHRDSEADKYFKKGWGKLYLMR